jgi:ABC-type nitrate/sulfonate/bicarbonate transport system ATPase subunit
MHTVLLRGHGVEEAMYLADRILALSPRLTTIESEFEIDLPHPRKLSEAKARRCGRRSERGGALGLVPASCTNGMVVFGAGFH